ncbi:conserved hypothetical membrane protein [Sphingobium sp. SYK-6]|uniref:lipopolysaccharide biosynthesis protein n=1 Tax=Sphingobium sp. (strain NBRC 103272 / SYK-6) TaxID=627192 RepID=UPI0002277DC9|nr:lipopolysaccharide biosynthesis protein [Sphingobium sp. SYK-6]BAK68381.1 conserved hypothetical membrane protein [Sphingobium sp. SYK-6]
MSSVAGQIIKGSLWLSGARAIVNALGWASTIVLARLLTPDDFGLVAIGTTIQAIIMAVTEMSLAQALVHHRAPDDDHLNTAWTLGFLRGLVIAAMLALAAHPLALLYEDPRLEWVIYAIAFGVFLGGLSNPRRVMLQRQLIFWQDFLLNVGMRLATVIVSIGVAVYYRNYWALILGGMAGQLVGLAISYMIMPFLPRFGLRHARELWSFSFWLTLGQTVNTINWRFDQLLIGKLLGRSELGYYSVGDNLAQMPTREATNPLRLTLFPAFSRISDDPARLRAAYQRAQGLITAMALPVGVGFALVAEPLVRVAMGDKWLPAVPIIQALSSIFAFQTFGSVVQPLAMSLGATKNLFHRDLWVFFVRLPIILTGLFFGGLPGLVVARMVSGTVSTIMNMELVRRLSGLGLRTQFGSNLRTLGAIAVMIVGVTACRRLAFTAAHPGPLYLISEVVILAATGAILYLGSHWLFWRLQGYPQGPEKEVRDLLGQALARLRRPQPLRSR